MCFVQSAEDLIKALLPDHLAAAVVELQVYFIRNFPFFPSDALKCNSLLQRALETQPALIMEQGTNLSSVHSSVAL